MPLSTGIPTANRTGFGTDSLHLTLLAVTLSLTLSCRDDSPKRATDRGDFVQIWEPIEGRELQTLSEDLQETALFEEAVEILNEHLELPRDLTVRHRSCGDANAYYKPGLAEIWLCYELLEEIAALASQRADLSQEELAQRVVSTWMFIFLHEVGHALVDVLEVPVLGKEEDAADEFATLLLLHTRGIEFTSLAAGYWRASGEGDNYDESAYADEHSLDPQRFYAILCLIYGSDPEGQEKIVSGGLLSEERAERCPNEYEQKIQAWQVLLASWLKSSLTRG